MYSPNRFRHPTAILGALSTPQSLCSASAEPQRYPGSLCQVFTGMQTTTNGQD